MKVVPLLVELAEVGSPPSRGRGLKDIVGFGVFFEVVVAPLAGAWIESDL